MELVLISALIALVSGTLLGVYTGINRKGFLVILYWPYHS